MDVTPRKRSKIITLANFTNKTYREIALECGVGKSTVARLIKQHAQTGSLSPTRVGRCGRKPRTTPRMDRLLVVMSKKDPRKTSEDLRRDIEAHGVDIDSSTVRRRLLKVGRKAHKPHSSTTMAFRFCNGLATRQISTQLKTCGRS